MNILPLVIGFLTILALTSYGFWQGALSSHLNAYTYRGYARAERLARNRQESTHYTDARKKDKPTNPDEKKSEPKEKPYQSPRATLPPGESSKLTITPLFTKPYPPLLYETAAKLIRILYGEASFFKNAGVPHLEYRLLDTLISKEKAPESLLDLLSVDSPFQEILYKMLRGTNIYDLKQGYPPLADFMTFEKKTGTKAISLPFASIPLLQALFDEKITQAIVAAEKTKWKKDYKNHPLEEAELDALLPPTGPNDTQIKDLLDFSKRHAAKLQRVTQDSKTKISVRHDTD